MDHDEHWCKSIFGPRDRLRTPTAAGQVDICWNTNAVDLLVRNTESSLHLGFPGLGACKCEYLVINAKYNSAIEPQVKIDYSVELEKWLRPRNTQSSETIKSSATQAWGAESMQSKNIFPDTNVRDYNGHSSDNKVVSVETA